MRFSEADILENDILVKYPNVLNILLQDHTTKANIFWATDNYQELGNEFSFFSSILPCSITGENGHVIMPRVKKNKKLQQSRVRKMAEVFTPSWVCNAQNNLIDNEWFGTEGVFNTELELEDETNGWKVNDNKIIFPNGKTWKHYVREKRLEIACGEAPYITSRYDTTTGEFIPVDNRIGLLDRKLRVINENVSDSENWLEATRYAFQSTYAFEWQGDSLLLAREAMLITFIENYYLKFGKEPSLRSIQNIANIISWNVWQMDGLRGIIPKSCKTSRYETKTIFNELVVKLSECEGCENGYLKRHNGIYCIIQDWGKIDPNTGKKGRKYRFIDLLNK